MGSWPAYDGVVHAVFEWYSEVHKKTWWATVCMQHDQIETFFVDDIPEVTTCLWCAAALQHHRRTLE